MSINRQRGSLLLGVEWDRDSDATDIAIHLLLITIEVTRSRACR